MSAAGQTRHQPGFAEANHPFVIRDEASGSSVPVLALLGGKAVFGMAPSSGFATHDMLAAGLPRAALIHFIDHLSVLEPAAVLAGIGLSLRTLQRHREAPGQVLTPEQSSRIWTFADILAKAVVVLGTRDAAERWLASPAAALDRRRPLDLLGTSAGTAMVDTLLGRLEYGVYT